MHILRRAINAILAFGGLVAVAMVLQAAVPAQETTITFAVIGDFGGNNSNEAAVANLVHSWRPDFVISLGDNNYPSGEAETIDDNVGQYYGRYIYPYSGRYFASGPPNRFYPSLGNHDWRAENAQPYLDYFDLLADPAISPSSGNERYYDFIKGPVHFFVLDSDPNEPDGSTFDSIQGEWLKTQLANSTTPWQIVYFHHAPYTSGKGNHSELHMRWPFEEWGADTVLAGHEHLYERLQVGNIPYVVNGLGGVAPYDFGPPLPESLIRYNENYGAMRVVASAERMTFEFFSIADGGTLIDSFVVDTPAPTPTPTPTPLPGTHTLRRSVATAADDAEELLDTQRVYPNSSDLEFVVDSDYVGRQFVGIRFQNLTIPPRSRILEAAITFTADERYADPTSLTISAQAADHALQFYASDSNISTRPLTTAITWPNVAPWPEVGEMHMTPDLSSLVQSIVNRPGWEYGNAIAFMFAGEGHRTAVAFDSNPSAAPRLTVKFVAPMPSRPAPSPFPALPTTQFHDYDY